jgi:hypothetical protein
MSGPRELLTLFGEVTYLKTRLEDAQDRVARDHPDNAAVFKNWHLIDIFCLPLQKFRELRRFVTS